MTIIFQEVLKGFNSKLVRLEAYEIDNLQVTVDSFNSKLVRLEVKNGWIFDWIIRFQFQIGAIRRHNVKIFSRMLTKFQFQIGAIRSALAMPDEFKTDNGFNSKLVRLEG